MWLDIRVVAGVRGLCTVREVGVVGVDIVESVTTDKHATGRSANEITTVTCRY